MYHHHQVRSLAQLVLIEVLDDPRVPLNFIAAADQLHNESGLDRLPGADVMHHPGVQPRMRALSQATQCGTGNTSQALLCSTAFHQQRAAAHEHVGSAGPQGGGGPAGGYYHVCSAGKPRGGVHVGSAWEVWEHVGHFMRRNPDLQKLRRSMGGVLKQYRLEFTCAPTSLLCTGAQLAGSPEEGVFEGAPPNVVDMVRGVDWVGMQGVVRG